MAKRKDPTITPAPPVPKKPKPDLTNPPPIDKKPTKKETDSNTLHIIKLIAIIVTSFSGTASVLLAARTFYKRWGTEPNETTINRFVNSISGFVPESLIQPIRRFVNSLETELNVSEKYQWLLENYPQNYLESIRKLPLSEQREFARINVNINNAALQVLHGQAKVSDYFRNNGDMEDLLFANLINERTLLLEKIERLDTELHSISKLAPASVRIKEIAEELKGYKKLGLYQEKQTQIYPINEEYFIVWFKQFIDSDPETQAIILQERSAENVRQIKEFNRNITQLAMSDEKGNDANIDELVITRKHVIEDIHEIRRRADLLENKEEREALLNEARKLEYQIDYANPNLKITFSDVAALLSSLPTVEEISGERFYEIPEKLDIDISEWSEEKLNELERVFMLREAFEKQYKSTHDLSEKEREFYIFLEENRQKTLSELTMKYGVSALDFAKRSLESAFSTRLGQKVLTYTAAAAVLYAFPIYRPIMQAASTYMINPAAERIGHNAAVGAADVAMMGVKATAWGAVGAWGALVEGAQAKTKSLLEFLATKK